MLLGASVVVVAFTLYRDALLLHRFCFRLHRVSFNSELKMHCICIFRKRSSMENTFDGIALNTILIDIVKCILFNKIRKIKGNPAKQREKERESWTVEAAHFACIHRHRRTHTHKYINDKWNHRRMRYDPELHFEHSAAHTHTHTHVIVKLIYWFISLFEKQFITQVERI